MSVERSAPATATKRELALLLSKEHGHKVAAQLADVGYDQLRQWSSREQRKQDKLIAVTNVTTPSQHLAQTRSRIADTLQRNEKQTRLNLSRAHRVHSVRAARGKLAPKETLQVAQAAAITHGWRNSKDDDRSQVAVNIAILSA